jgi:GNAT superfamily N-acetyltransferase
VAHLRGPVRTDDVSIIAAIDRAEHVDTEYRVVDGKLEAVPATIPDIPAWDTEGNGPHSVAHHIAFCESALARGGVLFATYDGERPAGLATVVPEFEPPMAWLALFFVSRPYRRQGLAQSLWNAAANLARDQGARTLYVSATPTESAVGFYLSRGCRLANPVHQELFELEPEDVHLICELA